MKYLLLLLFLAGCNSSRPSAESIRLFGDYCESEGNERGSVEFNLCVTRVAEKK